MTVAGINLASAALHPGFIESDLICRFGGSSGRTTPAKVMPGSDGVQCETPINFRDDAGTEVGR